MIIMIKTNVNQDKQNNYNDDNDNIIVDINEGTNKVDNSKDIIITE